MNRWKEMEINTYGLKWGNFPLIISCLKNQEGTSTLNWTSKTCQGQIGKKGGGAQYHHFQSCHALIRN